MEGTLMSLEGFIHRTQIGARFKRALLFYWLPLVVAAVVPVIVTILVSWFQGPEPEPSRLPQAPAAISPADTQFPPPDKGPMVEAPPTDLQHQ
jgi:hypothetical protein